MNYMLDATTSSRAVKGTIFSMEGGKRNRLIGGAGVDQFVLVDGKLPGPGNRIVDFEAGTDKLVINDLNGLSQFSDLSITKQGTDTAIAFGGRTLVVLAGVSEEAIAFDNFEFSQPILEPSPEDNDTEAPVITASLVNDTGSGGDRITSDGAIAGIVTDESEIASVQISLDDGNTFTDILADVQPDGRFTLSQQRLEALKGGALSDGTFTGLFVATDAAGNTAAPVSLEFTLDTRTAISSVGLATISDSAPVGDGQTTQAVVTLTGQAEANGVVRLQATGATTTADATGQFEFANVGLAVGDNAFTVEVTDIAGNTATRTATITRLASEIEDATPPVIRAGLVNDTGS